MGTRARIGMLNPDGTITSIYTHWDGYPEHHAPILTNHYTDPDKIRALLDLGDLSSLGHELGEKHDFYRDTDDPLFNVECNAYGRDRGEDDCEAKTHKANEWPDYGQEFEYLADRGGEWFFRRPSDPKWESLTPDSKT